MRAGDRRACIDVESHVKPRKVVLFSGESTLFLAFSHSPNYFMWARTTSQCQTANWRQLFFFLKAPVPHLRISRLNRRTWYWYALPPWAKLRNFLWYGRMDMWKYASLRSIVTNQSSDLICGTIYLKVNILNLSCLTESFRTRRSKKGCNPPSFFGTMKYRQ